MINYYSSYYYLVIISVYQVELTVRFYCLTSSHLFKTYKNVLLNYIAVIVE